MLAQLSCICNKHLHVLDVYLNKCKTLKIEESQVEFTFAKVAFPLYFTHNVKLSDAVLSTKSANYKHLSVSKHHICEKFNVPTFDNL